MSKDSKKSQPKENPSKFSGKNKQENPLKDYKGKKNDYTNPLKYGK